MTHAFYPFVEEPAGESAPSTTAKATGADMATSLAVTNAARIAVYDDAAAAPRVVVVEPADVRTYLEEITATVTRLAQEQGGAIPFTVIREIVENLIHAYFAEPIISVLSGGNTIRFADQGPGITDKHRALQYGTSSATDEMKHYIRGVGSGLPYVQQWMADKGGSLTIEDNISKGTIITLTMAGDDEEGEGEQPGNGDQSPVREGSAPSMGVGAPTATATSAEPMPQAPSAQPAASATQQTTQLAASAAWQTAQPQTPGTTAWQQPPAAEAQPSQAQPSQQAPAALRAEALRAETWQSQTAQAQPAQPWQQPAQSQTAQPPQQPTQPWHPQAAQPWQQYPQQAGQTYQQDPASAIWAPSMQQPAQPWPQPSAAPTQSWTAPAAYQSQAYQPWPANTYPAQQTVLTPQPYQAPVPGYAPQGTPGPYPQRDTTNQVSERGMLALGYLATHEQVGPTELVAAFGHSQSTWTRELKALEDVGLVAKRGGQKRHLTPLGQAFLTR